MSDSIKSAFDNLASGDFQSAFTSLGAIFDETFNNVTENLSIGITKMLKGAEGGM